MGRLSLRHYILCVLLLVCVFSGTAWGTFARRSQPSDSSAWVHHKTWDVWVRRPEGWRRHDVGLGADMIFQYIDPAGRAAFEVHALHLPSQDGSLEALADALEASMRMTAGYFSERLSDARVAVAGGEGLAREYHGPVGSTPVRAAVRYIRRKGAVFVVLCAYPESLAGSYEQVAGECVESFRLRAPRLSGAGKQSSPATRLCSTILADVFGEWVHDDDFNFWAYRPACWRDQEKNLPRNGVRCFNEPGGNAGLVIYAAELPHGKFAVEQIADASEAYFAARTPFLERRLSSRCHPVRGARGILRRYRGSVGDVETRSTVLYVLQDKTFFVIFGFCAEPVAARCGDALTQSVTSFHFASPEAYPELDGE